jgi:hypothetical protein
MSKKNNTVCLSIVFNHQFEKNIPILRKIYGGRFSTIRYLSPFSKWKKDDDIIPVFESSTHFQGYFAQAYPYLPKDYDYYVFCADDLILNPTINENNIIDLLNCRGAGYIKYLNPLSEHSFAWHKFYECVHFPPDDCIIPHTTLLPGRDELIKRYAHHGISTKNLGLSNLKGAFDKRITWERIRAGLGFLLRNGFKRFLPYPLTEGYSDLVVIRGTELKEFAFYCGVFASMNLWVDAAVATAMVLSCDVIRTEKEHTFNGVELWGEDQELPEKEHNLNLESLLSSFSSDKLYLHPVKLSRWNNFKTG